MSRALKIHAPLFVSILGLAVVLVGCTPQQQQQAADILSNTNSTDGQVIEGSDATKDSGVMEADDTIRQEDKMMDDAAEPISYSGARLAGAASPLLDFNQADYDAAIAAGKTVFLYFYANWCPTCAAEQPHLTGAFNELARNDVVGFRVNYRDDQTDASEVALARQHGVAYQHTKVVIKDGQVVLKSPESWQIDRYLEEINAL